MEGKVKVEGEHLGESNLPDWYLDLVKQVKEEDIRKEAKRISKIKMKALVRAIKIREKKIKEMRKELRDLVYGHSELFDNYFLYQKFTTENREVLEG